MEISPGPNSTSYSEDPEARHTCGVDEAANPTSITPTVPSMAAPPTAEPPQDVPVLQPEPRKIYPKWGQAPIPDIVDLLGMLTILSHDFIYLCKSHVIIRMTMNK